MVVPAGWTSLGCATGRCCCCPATVYYPPTLNVNWHDYVPAPNSAYTSDQSFTVACYYLDCPRGTSTTSPRPAGCPAPTSPCATGTTVDGDGNCTGWTGQTGYVLRCHACNYQLLGADGRPGIKPILNAGTGLYEVPSTGPKIFAGFDGGGSPLYDWVIGFVFKCSCDTGEPLADFPAIPTNHDPNTGVDCGWETNVTTVQGNASGVLGATFVPTTLTMNRGSWVGDGSGDYPNPPFVLFWPLDPFKYSCCPLRVRFLDCQYEPQSWCDNPNGSWADPSEWPPHPGELTPWNFPVPFCAGNPSGGCGYAATGTACGCTAGQSWACQLNPNPDFGYVEVTGATSCFGTDGTNCLNALQADGNTNAC